MMTALACGGYRAVNATIEGVITWEGYAQGADPRGRRSRAITGRVVLLPDAFSLPSAL